MFLIAIIDKTDIYMVAPECVNGYSHIVKKEGTLTGVIGDDKLLLDMHINPQSLTGKNFASVRDMTATFRTGDYDILMATKDLIYHIDKNKSIFVSPSIKIVGQHKDVLTGVFFALSNLEISVQDKIQIAMKAINAAKYEVIKA